MSVPLVLLWSHIFIFVVGVLVGYLGAKAEVWRSGDHR